MKTSSDKPVLFESREPLECPKCGKHLLVETTNGKYHCLSCNFKRDLNESSSGDTPLPVLITLLLFIILIVL